MHVTKTSDHNRVAFMSCLQKVVYKVEYMYEKTCENVYARSDGMGSQIRHRNVFKLLASTVLPGKTLPWYYNERYHAKGPIDRLERTVKNAIFRKIKYGQLARYSKLESSETVRKFVPLIHSVYLPENENIVEPEDISKARKID